MIKKNKRFLLAFNQIDRPQAHQVPQPGILFCVAKFSSLDPGQNIAGIVWAVHSGGAPLGQHLRPRGLCVGGDGPLGLDGFHGHGTLCRLYCLRQAAQS